ncbi:MAG: hypothetical protein R3E95_03595 [Thiolinea sp.]
MLPLSGNERAGSNPRMIMMKTLHMLETAPLTLVAEMAKTTPEALQQRLQAQNIQVDNVQQTLEEIARNNQKRPQDLLPQLLP